MKLVYIASPLSGDIQKNTGRAREYCKWAAEQGAAPVAVHLLYPQFLDEHNPAERELGCNMGLRVLAACDELWAFGERISPGMAAEIKEAQRLGIPTRAISELELQRKTAMKYGVWAVRSAASVAGHAEAWCKNDGEPVTFDTMEGAEDYAGILNKSVRTANVHYYAKEMPQELSQGHGGMGMTL